MSTLEKIDKELLIGLEQIPDLSCLSESYQDLREQIESFRNSQTLTAIEGVEVESCMIPSRFDSHQIELMVYRPLTASKEHPAVLHIHGGGYVLGHPFDCHAHNLQLAREVQCTVIATSYRLAPDHQAPAQLQDCYSALSWVFDNLESLNIDGQKVAISGDSAGGGLAAALAIYARDRGEHPICFQLLNAPMLDDRTCTRSDLNPHVGEFVWPQAANRFGWKSLLGCEPGQKTVPDYSVAARTEDLSGLPPTYITIGSHDLFLQENIEYATRLLANGVTAELHVLPAAFHGFEVAADAHLTKTSLAARHAAFKRAFYTSQ